MMQRVLALGALLIATSALTARGDAWLQFDFDRAHEPATGSAAQINVFGEPSYAPGVFGDAIVIAPHSDKLTVRLTDDFNPTAGTCVLWAKPMGWSPIDEQFHFFATLIESANPPFDRMNLYKVNSGAELAMYASAPKSNHAASIRRSIVAWQDRQWHHLAMTWENGGEMRLYCDGELVAHDVSTDMAAGVWHLILGNPWGDATAKIGDKPTAIDDLRLYDRALSPDELKQLYIDAMRSSATLQQQSAAMSLPDRTNYATAGFGAYALASSFRDARLYYPDHLIDDDADTAWQAFDAQVPQWIELRWPCPVTVDGIALQQITPTDIQKIAVYGMVDFQWKRIGPIDGSFQSQYGIVRAGVETTTLERLKIVIEDSADQNIVITSAAAYGPQQIVYSGLEPYWHASYIWYPEPDRRHKAESPRYFRRTFAIDDLASLHSAFMQFRSNDYYRTWVNGIEVATGSTKIQPVDVGAHLREGDNVIAIVTDINSVPNHFGWAELLAELSLNFETHNQYVGTDDTWLSHNQQVDGWRELDFDDSAWQPAYVYTQPPGGPWGRIPYYPRARYEQVALTDVIVPDEPARPGDRVRVTLALRAVDDLHKDYLFRVQLGRDSVDPVHEDFTVAADIVSPALNDEPWHAGRTVRISTELTLPPWTPDGDIPLRVSALDTDNGLPLRIVDDSGQAAGPIAGIRVARQASRPTGDKPVARVVRHNGHLVFEIDGEPVVPLSWKSHSLDYERIHQYAAAGPKLFFVMDYNKGTIEEKLAHLDNQIRQILDIVPDAYIIPTLDVRVLQTWMNEHPDERMRTAFGDMGPVSFASTMFHRRVLDKTERLVDYLESQPYADRIVGYRMMCVGRMDSGLGGSESNNFQTDRDKLTLGDYSPQAIELFNQYVRDKYANDVEKLRAAWNDPSATFDDTAPINRDLVGDPVDDGVFHDPRNAGKRYDYFEFFAKLVPWNYERIARLIKDKTHGRALVGVHYGYVVGHMRMTQPTGPLRDNDFGFGDMLDNGVFDFFCGAPDYSCREAGDPHRSMFPLASINLHDKLYVSDSDYRTFIAHMTTYGRQRSADESVAVIRREMTNMAIDNFGCWFADFSAGRSRSAVAWYNDPRILESIGSLHDVYRDTVAHPRQRNAEIAVIVSPETWYFHDVYNAQNIYNNLIVAMLWNELPHIGAPFDVYLASDLDKAKVQQDYKLYVMINPYYMSQTERAAVESLKRDGKTVLWFYAPGYVDRQRGLTVDGVAETTGIHVRIKDAKHELMQYTLDPDVHAITRGIDGDVVHQAAGFWHPDYQAFNKPAFGPVFYVADDDARTLGRYPDGTAAVAVRAFDDWTSVYCAVPYADRSLLHAVAREAGVHIYSSDNIILNTDGRHMYLHNGFDGDKQVTIALPTAKDVFDIDTNERIAESATRFRVTVPACSTTILRFE